MYQSPDLIKVNLDVKDNFAAYASCIERVWTTDLNGTCDQPGYVFQTWSQLYPADPYTCYNDLVI